MSFVQNLIRSIENEVKALKASMPLNLGQLNFPAQTPSVSYSGSINTSSSDLVICRLQLTFTRSDGKSEPPFVNFAFNASVSPTMQEVMAGMGVSLSGNDLREYEDFFINGYVSATGTGSVTFNVDVKNAVAPWGSSPKTLTVNAQAISTLEGTLTLERTI